MDQELLTKALEAVVAIVAVIGSGGFLAWVQSKLIEPVVKRENEAQEKRLTHELLGGVKRIVDESMDDHVRRYHAGQMPAAAPPGAADHGIR